MNYSTAKTILRKYKYEGNELNLEALIGISHWYENYAERKVRCSYR